MAWKQEEYSSKARQWFILYLIVLLIYFFFMISVFIMEFSFNIYRLHELTDIIAVVLYIFSIFYISKLWYEYHNNSKRAEIEQLESHKRFKEMEEIIKSKYEEHGKTYETTELLRFDHKKARREISILYSLTIILNMIFMIGTIFW